MRSIGFSEIFIILMVLATVVSPVVLLVWLLSRYGGKGSRGSTIAVRVAQSCQQQIPCIGSYCPMCGQRVS